jgi:hypothetical protein
MDVRGPWRRAVEREFRRYGRRQHRLAWSRGRRWDGRRRPELAEDVHHTQQEAHHGHGHEERNGASHPGTKGGDG